MIIVCWSVKGGSGTTVVATSLALSYSHVAPDGALLVDLAGDVPLVLGLSTGASPGVGDWLTAPPGVGHESLAALEVAATESLRVLPRGSGVPIGDGRWSALADALARRGGVTVIDAGCAPVPPALLEVCDESLLVVRPCYLALHRASAHNRPTGIVLVREPGRRLTARDVSAVVGAPVRVEVDYDPAIARAVDAGLLVSRLPHTFTHALRGAA